MLEYSGPYEKHYFVEIKVVCLFVGKCSLSMYFKEILKGKGKQALVKERHFT